MRVTANEIRKRLGQCYSENQDSRHKVRIRLARGAYIPDFEFVRSDHSNADGQEPLQEAYGAGNSSSDGGELSEEPHDPLVLSSDETEPSKGSLQAPVAPTVEIQSGAHAFAGIARRPGWLAVIAMLVLTAGAISFHYGRARSRQDLFWQPLLHFDQPLIVCVADDPSLVNATEEKPATNVSDASATGQSLGSSASDWVPVTPFMEMSAANQITSWFVAHGARIFLQRASTVTLHIFRQGPAVLIGSFDNPWSLILTSNLRYHLRRDPSTHERWIEDAQNPAKRDWEIMAAGLHFDDTYVDYALVTRFKDSETGNWVVAVSSLGPHGSRAATELITDKGFAQSLPPGITASTNLQLVLKTSVIKGTTSFPQVVAVHTW